MEIKTDILIIGSGIAGLYAALHAAEFANVIIVTKKDRSESNTNYAQGGIASVISTGDSFASHIKDTLIAGAGLCDEKVVEILVNEGPKHISKLMEIGVGFTKNNQNLSLAKEGGHSHARIVHAKDLTGKEVERALLHYVGSLPNVQVWENHMGIDLITEHHLETANDKDTQERHCWGAFVLDIHSGTVKKVLAKATLLATGGLGQVYLHTTNPGIATGDGFAMAYRAGALLGNMEFVQFHPTALYEQRKNMIGQHAFLISEAVRGFGGILRTTDGNRFMLQYDDRHELAPRDIVARAIDAELKRRGEDFVYLDITHKTYREIVDHFPNIYEHCKTKGLDISKEYIPVVPAAHYACGGIVVDTTGQTSITGLFGAGEVTMTGVHGANRLASNSLLEALVFSARASDGMQLYLEKKIEIPSAHIAEWKDTALLTADEKVLISHGLKELKELMWDYVGIVRSNIRLEYADRRIANLKSEIDLFYKKNKVFDTVLELRNLIDCADMIVKSAQMRHYNIGLHYSLDYTEAKKEEKAVNTLIQSTYQRF